MRAITKNLSGYLTLFGILFFGLLGLALFSYDSQFQLAVAISMGMAFVVWGVVHHWLIEGLKARLVFEYLAIAGLGVTVLLSLLWGR